MPSPYNDQQRVAFYAMMGELQKLASQLHFRITDFILLAEVAAGDTAGRPWDSTSLALHLGLPRQTVVRKLKFMCDKSYIAPVREGHRIVFVRTDEGIRNWRPVAHCMIDRVTKYVHTQHNLHEF
jgi:hypothetical protein